jgi:hypothetical protein
MQFICFCAQHDQASLEPEKTSPARQQAGFPRATPLGQDSSTASTGATSWHALSSPRTASTRLTLVSHTVTADCSSRAAQISPIDVRPKLFAADGAVSGFLDVRASFCWNFPQPGYPLANSASRNTEAPGKHALSADNLAHSLNSIHARNYSRAKRGLSIAKLITFCYSIAK